ncbi:hypothetical protein [Streptomyces sp. NPDC006551]|uniref:hypothetical protein n=1 Tax=Streptomyces sp. NPDC006551 TaxID=3157178 RepID=UPI0033BC17D2
MDVVEIGFATIDQVVPLLDDAPGPYGGRQGPDVADGAHGDGQLQGAVTRPARPRRRNGKEEDHRQERQPGTPTQHDTSPTALSRKDE